MAEKILLRKKKKQKAQILLRPHLLAITCPSVGLRPGPPSLPVPLTRLPCLLGQVNAWI